jgi:hypothetical protein
MTAIGISNSTAGHGLLRSLPPIPSIASLPPDRCGRLRNGARPGDFLAAPRCGARTRSNCACRQPAMENGRCRMHGGLSTGPRTPAGRERCRRARLTHGFYSAEMAALRRASAACCRRMDAIVGALKVRRTAGHGVHRSISTTSVAGPSSGAKINHRGHRDHGAESHAYVARHHPSSVRSVSSAVTSSSAGHGLHPSFSRTPLSPRARRLLAGAGPLAAFSAGHGVLPSFSLPAAIVPAGTP